MTRVKSATWRTDTELMRLARCLAKLGVGVVATAGVLGAGFWIWERGTMEPTTWVVSEVRDDQHTLVVAWAMAFGRCAQRPSLEVEEGDTEIRLQAEHRVKRDDDCGRPLAGNYPPVVVHLERPLAGRKLVGDDQADEPVPFETSWMTASMPEVIGMDAAAARRALSRARYKGAGLPSTDSVGFVIKQWPLPGTNLSPEGHIPKGPPPRLTFSQRRDGSYRTSRQVPSTAGPSGTPRSP